MTRGYRCPECGAGFRRDNSEGGIEVLLPRNWPMHSNCATCQQRSESQMQELGRRTAERHESQILKHLLGERPVIPERGQRVRDKRDKVKYEFGYVSQAGYYVCYLPSCRNMQDSVAILPEHLEVLDTTPRWESVT